MSLDFKNELAERLIRYASIDSQSDEESATVPSSKIQYDMLYLLEKELKEKKKGLNLLKMEKKQYLINLLRQKVLKNFYM